MIASLTEKTPSSIAPTKQHPYLPYLWTEDIVPAQSLTQCFRIGLPGSEGEGEHIIAMQSEVAIRLLSRKIQSAGGKVSVFSCDKPLSNSIATMGLDAAPVIIMGVQPYEQWLKSLKNKPLELEDAVAIAEDILRLDAESPERNIALEMLRRRAGVSEYNWDKKYLNSIRAKLERALALPTEVSPLERRRLELLALAQERDPDKFIDDRIAFCRRYGWSRQEVDQRIRQLKTSTTTPKAKRLTGKDFLALETESISWVFPGIIPSRGVFVIGGHAGAGKTTFAYDAVGSLLLGEEFLGEKPVKTGKVLIVMSDELPCFTQDKLIERGIPGEGWETLQYWDVSQWDKLEEAIADLKPALVVIDSFSSIHRDPSFDENSSQAKSTIYDLEALTNTYNCGCILIHHLSKSKENQGVGKLRGSSAISAAASVVCLMEQTSSDTRKLSFPKVRGAQTKPFLVNLNNSTGRYEVISGGDDVGTKSLGDRILAELAKDPYKRFEQEEISGLLGIPSSQKDSVYQALARLFKRGLITKRPSTQGGKRKVYGVANPSQLSHTEGLRNVTDTIEDTPPPSSLYVSVEISETVDIQGIELTDTLTDSLTDTLLTHKNDVHGEISSNEELESVSAKLTITDSQGCVCSLSVETVTPEAGDLAIAPAPAPAEVAQPELPIYQRSAGGFQVNEADLWLDEETIQDIVGHLQHCSDREALAELRKAWTSEAAKNAMDIACDQLSAEKSAQIEQWVNELNAGEPC